MFLLTYLLMDSSLIHQQCFVHHVKWVVLYLSHPSTIVLYIIWYGFLHLSHPSRVVFLHHLVCAVLHGSHPPAVVSCIIWYGFFFSLIHQLLLCAPSAMGSSSLCSSINSCFVHHLYCFVHHLVWVVLHWTDPSIVVLYIIWYGFLHLLRPSTVVLYIIWYG